MTSRIGFVLAGVLSLSAVVSATSIHTDAVHQDAARVAQSPAVPLVPARPKDLFGKLFAPTPRKPISQSSPESFVLREQPRVLCGMVLIPADPTIDPKIIVKPQEPDIRFTIRAIEPPMCWDSR